MSNKENTQQSTTPFNPLMPFDEAGKLELFPIKSLPGAVRDMVEALAISTQTPPEMAGVLALGVLSTLYQRRFKVRITEDWTEPLNLYCVAIAQPGERKSAVLSTLTEPIREFERDQRFRDAEKVEQNKTQRQILEGQLAQLKKEAAKNPDNTEAAEQALEFASKLANFKDLHPLRLLADDATPEKLVDLMEQQDGCLTICSAEGGVFDAMDGRYDKTVNLDVYLKAHAGDPVIVDRISRRTSHIDTPRLTMLLTIQPEILSGIMSNMVFRGRGLTARFLFGVCNSKVGHREINPPPIPYETREEYRYFIRRALGDQHKGVIRLSPEGDSLRQSYQMVIEERLGTEWENMRDWGGKLTGAMLRIAALIHCAEAGNADPTRTEISVGAVNRAINIAEVLGNHASRAYSLMGADRDVEDAQYILKRLAGERTVTRSDLVRLCRGRFKKATDMEPALDILIDRGYMRVITSAGYNNRTLLNYELNPTM